MFILSSYLSVIILVFYLSFRIWYQNKMQILSEIYKTIMENFWKVLYHKHANPAYNMNDRPKIESM